MKPSEALDLHREAIRSIVISNGACNPRIFGSVLHGTDTVCSDLDILVDPIDGVTTLISLVNIGMKIEALTGFKADVFTPLTLKEIFMNAVMSEAVSI